jgi:hypothetical protein
MLRICKKQYLQKIIERKGLLFHIIGILSVIWFMIRVLPAPHRSQYPCQQVTMPLSLTYIGFCSALTFGFITWIKKVQKKTIAISPAFLIVSILMFSIAGIGFANPSHLGKPTYDPWDPISKQPIGTPMGLYPGRVVWIWNPNATEKDLTGYWWNPQNNNPEVIKEMFSQGLQALVNKTNDQDAWNALFTYFNQQKGKGNVGYTAGEKIAIKVNLNNCYNPPYSGKDDYETEDNERDAHPDVIKTLLYHLINIIGVEPKDITIYDASRPIPNWFYEPISMEYPNIYYVDALGGAPGRTKVQPSETSFYFADGVIRTIPVCVKDAEYLINIPLLKQHPINHGVTLSGKNLFGTFIEEVVDLHPYHESGQIIGNMAPQVDLLASEELGGKTLLYIGDGLYATLNDHRTIYHFHMNPFNDDWTNSLFFSQDPIAIDSVMYDFLHTEGPIPIEGSQNYLHQGANPDKNSYDPEGDGIYVSESIGVHEHWDISVDIFSNERYSGIDKNGIDFVPLGSEHQSVRIVITQPAYQRLYLFNTEQSFRILYKDYYTFPATIVIGPITVKVDLESSLESIERIDFYVDGKIKTSINEPPYEWNWNTPTFGKHVLSVSANSNNQGICHADRELIKIL